MPYNKESRIKNLESITRSPKYAHGWVRRAVESAHTQQEWIEIFRGLPPVVQVRTLVDLQPKETKAENTNIIRLLIENVSAHPAIQAREVKELAEHENDDETVD